MEVVWTLFWALIILESRQVAGDTCSDVEDIRIGFSEDAEVGTIHDHSSTVNTGTKVFTIGNMDEYVTPIIQDNSKLRFQLTKSIHDVPDGPNAVKILTMKIRCNVDTEPSTTVTLFITPVNDHSPIFNKTEYAGTVHQSMPGGYFILDTDVISVTDQDMDSSMEVRIQEGNVGDTFELVKKAIGNGPVKVFEYRVKTKNLVLVQDSGYYELKLNASDMESQPRFGTSVMKIKITPVDTMDPIFEETNYHGDLFFDDKNNEITVKEDSATLQGSPVGNGKKLKMEKLRPKANIKAFDQDELIKTPLQYELVPSGEQPDWTQYFELGADQSLSLVKADKILWGQTSITLLIKASQMDNPQRMAFSTITFHIRLPPVKPPYFEQRLQVLRRSKPNDVIYELKIVEDSDNADVNFQETDILGMRANKIYLKKTIPDDKDTLEAEIVVKRKGPLDTSSSKVEVIFDVISWDDGKLLDLPGSAHFVRVPDDAEPGHLLFQVETKEEASFQAVAGDTTFFTLDRSNGNITLRERLHSAYYHLTIEVQSTKNQRKNATLQLLFLVDIKRTLTTIFKKGLTHVDLPLHTVTGSPFYKPEVVNGSWEITYAAVDVNQVFQVDSNGDISLLKNISADEEYQLNVTATVVKPEPMTDETTIIFHVVTIKRPLTGIFTKSQHSVSVIECQEIGQDLFTIPVNDLSGQNYTFEVTGGNEEYFHLDAQTPIISLKSKLGREENDSLDVLAWFIKDSQKIEDRTKVIFQVIDSEECQLFLQRSYSLDLSPNTETGTAVYRLGYRRSPTFQIYEGDRNTFHVNETTGVITTQEVLVGEEYSIGVKAETNTNPVIEDTTTVRFHVRNCSAEGDKETDPLFTKNVYRVRVRSENQLGSKLDLEELKPPGTPPVKYLLLQGNEAFRLSENGELFLDKRPEELTQSLYFLLISAVPSANYLLDDTEIPEVGLNEALVIVNVDQPPKFLHEPLLLKVLLPTASLSEYVLDIKAASSRGKPIKFSLKEDNQFFKIYPANGRLYPAIDVTGTAETNFEMTVVATEGTERDTMTAELKARIVRLKPDQTIVITSEKRHDFTELERALQDATGLTIVILRYQELPKRNSYTMYSENIEVSFAMAAFKDGQPEPLTIDHFKQEETEANITGSIGDFEMSAFEEGGDKGKVEYVVEYKDADNGGLVATVAVLGVFLGLIVVSTLGFLLRRKYKLRRNKVRPPTPPLSRRFSDTSFNKNYNFATRLSSKSIESSVSVPVQYVEECEKSSYAELDTVDSPGVDLEARRENSEVLPQNHRSDSPIPSPSYPNQANTDSIMERNVEVEKEDASSNSLQVPTQLEQTPLPRPEEIEPDYPSDSQASPALSTASVSRKSILHKEDSFGLDLEESAKNNAEEVPEAFNNDLIDDEDVDTGEPGGTPHVHRKHVEIHVQEDDDDMSDEEEEQMLQRIAAIPQRKSVVTFSDKTETIP